MLMLARKNEVQVGSETINRIDIYPFVIKQVHHESAQLVSVSANLVNKVMANNPQLVK